jgi:hypothetical protein
MDTPDPKDDRVKHYILVECRGEDAEAALWALRAVRRAIHDAIRSKGLNAADMPIRSDRELTYYGFPEPLEEAQRLWEHAMASFEQAKAQIPRCPRCGVGLLRMAALNKPTTYTCGHQDYSTDLPKFDLGDR